MMSRAVSVTAQKKGGLSIQPMGKVWQEIRVISAEQGDLGRA
jgi:hypothetical protein